MSGHWVPAGLEAAKQPLSQRRGLISGWSPASEGSRWPLQTPGSTKQDEYFCQPSSGSERCSGEQEWAQGWALQLPSATHREEGPPAAMATAQTSLPLFYRLGLEEESGREQRLNSGLMQQSEVTYELAFLLFLLCAPLASSH